MIALPTSSRGGFAEDWTMVFSMPKIFACTWWKLREDQQAGFSHIERYMLDIIYIYNYIYGGMDILVLLVLAMYRCW